MAVQFSIQKLVSDGTLSTIALGIQYLQRNDIYMRIAGEETPQNGAPSGYTWAFVDSTTLKILPVVPNGTEVVIYRRTDINAMYNIYSQNAQFDEATIDENNQQLLYIAQEYLEQGIPGAGVDYLEYVNTVNGINYYRFRLTDGSFTAVFGVPDGTDTLRTELYSNIGATKVRYAQSGAGSITKDIASRFGEYVTPEEYGALHTVGVDDTAPFHLALATGKRVKLGAHTYYVNLVLSDHFDIEGQGMDCTRLVAFDKNKPVIKNMYQEPKWNYPTLSQLTISGSGTNEGVGFSFGDFSTYSTGDELIGRVHMTDVYFTNLDKCVLKCYGNIGNIFENVSAYGGNYFYYARGAKFGNPSAGIMHAGADMFVGGQVTGMQKMCFLVLDTTPGIGQWTFINTILQFNPGGTFMWDVSGTSLTAFESTSFINIWNEGNASAGSVTIDGLSGPRTITPSSKFQQTAYGPDYCNWGKTLQHGTTSILGRANIWGSERIALNLESGGIGGGSTNDYVDLAFSSAAYPNTAGAWLRSTRGTSFGRNIAIHTATGISADFNIDGGSTIGVAANTPNVPATTNKLRANVATGGPFSSTTKINLVDNQNYSATLAGMHLGSIISSNRSLNAAGTINASGADYAEYMYKDVDCGTIPKGAICGITKEGLLTDRFDKSISFVIKSTDPAYVGGDSWGHSVEPVRFTPEYTAWISSKNALLNAEYYKPLPIEGESESEFVKRIEQWEAEVYSLTVAVAQEPTQYESDEWLAWNTAMEAKRQRVDRVAFSGQVPCNVMGAVSGDYIVPVRLDNGTIGGISVKSPTFEQYISSVGKVWSVLQDGRAWVAVKVV
jgi:hypothetical protein